jgi:hypothetical protein
LGFRSMCTFFLHWIRAGLWPTEHLRSDSQWLTNLGHKKHCNFYISCLESQSLCCKKLKQPGGEVHNERNWDLLPTARTTFPGLWGSHVQSSPFSLSQSFRWL